MSSGKEICVPDIGGAVDVDVIEMHVAVGDKVGVEDSLITLEGDKATMDIPSPDAGVIKAISVAVGDKVSQGSPILVLDVASDEQPAVEVAEAEVPASSKPSEPVSRVETQPEPPVSAAPSEPSTTPPQPEEITADVHAGPAVRRLARELGVNLALVKGSGEKGRIVKTDVDQYVKQQLSQLAFGSASVAQGVSVTPAPAVDFSQFGETERCELTRIKKLASAGLHRNWVTIPHVTQMGEADITELEAFRSQHKLEAEKRGFKLTPVAFVMKALVTALKAFPHFNASLEPDGQHLVLKHYFNIGVAVDTPDGLVVLVIRQVDQKSVFELAEALSVMSEKARAGQLSMSDMQGSSFTLSSLGGIGGTAFTPIVNAPDVAILGLSKAQIKPVYRNDAFVPRLILPLSLSYDHRVIDGADGARFIVYLANCLSDIRCLLL